MRMRTLAVPMLVLLAGFTLAACGDTEPAATSSDDSMMEETMTPDTMESEDAMMDEDDTMMEESHSPDAMESDAMATEDAMMEDEG